MLRYTPRSRTVAPTLAATQGNSNARGDLRSFLLWTVRLCSPSPNIISSSFLPIVLCLQANHWSIASTLDHILQSYGLPRDGYSRDNLSLNLGRSTLSGLSLGRPLGLNDRLNDTDRVREQKLRNLFEFLGVDMRDGLGSFGVGLGGRDLLGAGRLGNRGPGLLRALDRY